MNEKINTTAVISLNDFLSPVEMRRIYGQNTVIAV